MSFFAELKRLRVFRVMAAYGVIGFGIIEAAEAIFPRVAIPDWAVTLVVWLTLLGFPIAVLLPGEHHIGCHGDPEVEALRLVLRDDLLPEPVGRGVVAEFAEDAQQRPLSFGFHVTLAAEIGDPTLPELSVEFLV